jgi:hypothetical protein
MVFLIYKCFYLLSLLQVFRFELLAHKRIRFSIADEARYRVSDHGRDAPLS